MTQKDAILTDKGRLDRLENENMLKTLQLNGLMSITQAINNNIKEPDLYKMYARFLNWELGIKRMALMIKREDGWQCNIANDIDPETIDNECITYLSQINKLSSTADIELPGLRQFDFIVPVLHKAEPIALVLIGESDSRHEPYDLIRFISTITNIITVAVENKRLFKRHVEQEKLNHEMQLASDVQRLLIPDNLPNHPTFQSASIYWPHIGIGGDYYDCIQHSPHEMTICIGDISGKGLAAAMLMANFQASMHAFIQYEKNLKNLIKNLNQSVFRASRGDKYITFFIAKIDAKAGTVEYINAGHTPPLINCDGKIKELTEGTTLLGTFEHLPFLESETILFQEACTMLCFTDGITDLVNNNGDFFSSESILEVFTNNWNSTANDLILVIEDTIGKYKEEQEYTDDLTVLAVKIKRQVSE